VKGELKVRPVTLLLQHGENPPGEALTGEQIVSSEIGDLRKDLLCEQLLFTSDRDCHHRRLPQNL
jgi:hypothetical protein